MIEDLPAQFDQFGKIVKEEDLFVCNRSEFGLGRENEERERFSDILRRTCGGVIGEELILVGIVEFIQQVVVEVFILFRVDLLPFGVEVKPEPVEEQVDVRIGVAAPFTGKILSAGGEFALVHAVTVGVIEDRHAWRNLRGIESEQMAVLMEKGDGEHILIGRIENVNFENPCLGIVCALRHCRKHVPVAVGDDGIGGEKFPVFERNQPCEVIPDVFVRREIFLFVNVFLRHRFLERTAEVIAFDEIRYKIDLIVGILF